MYKYALRVALSVFLLCLSAAVAEGQSFSQSGLTRALTVAGTGTLDYCADFTTESEFTTWDEAIAVRYRVVGGRKGDVLRIEWIPPEGAALGGRSAPTTSDYSGCYAWVLGVADVARPLGNWRVRLYINDVQLINLPFRLTSGPASPLSYTISKIPKYVPSDTDQIPYAIHNGGQIVFSTNSDSVGSFLGSRANSLYPSTQLGGLPGTNAVVRGVDVREGIFFGSTTLGGQVWGFRKAGDVTLFSYPGATATEIRGMWKLRDIMVGRFSRSDGVDHGFLHSGQFSLLEPKDSVSSEANGVNALGTVVGSFTDARDVRHGFIWRSGTFTTLDIPGARATRPWGVNDGGQVVGSFVDGGGQQHGFAWNAGAFRQLDVPGASMTAAYGINGSGQVVGVYREGNGPLQGFAAHLSERPLAFCSNDVRASFTEFPVTGGIQEMTLVTGDGCPMPVFTDAPWIRVNPLFDNGSGKVQILATANNSVARTGNVYSWFVKFPVSQRGAIGAIPTISAVTNGASFAAGIPSGGWFAVSGSGLSATSRTWTTADFSAERLPLSLDGVSVKVGGVSAFPYFVSPAQLNVLAPFNLPEGNVVVEVNGPNGRVTTQGTVRRFDPAFFLIGPQKDGLAPAAAVHLDGTLVADSGSITGVVSRPAAVGDLITLFGTGFGPTFPDLNSAVIVSTPAVLENAPAITIGGRQAQVLYAGVVSSGLVQVNIRVPENLSPGIHAIAVTVGGRSSTTIASIAVR